MNGRGSNVLQFFTFNRRSGRWQLSAHCGGTTTSKLWSKLVVIYDPLARRMVHGVDHDHHPRHYGSHPPSRIVGTINVSPYNDPEGIAWRVCNP